MQKNLSQTIPRIMERKEPARAEIFATSMVAELVNARVAIKMDIVKPIPASIPAPMMCRHEVLAGSVPHLNCIVK